MSVVSGTVLCVVDAANVHLTISDKFLKAAASSPLLNTPVVSAINTFTLRWIFVSFLLSSFQSPEDGLDKVFLHKQIYISRGGGKYDFPIDAEGGYNFF